MSTNLIKISGKIKGINFVGRRAEVTIETTTKTINGQFKRENPIIVFGGPMKDKLKEFNVYDRVYVEAEVATKAYLENDKRKYTQKLYGNLIEARMDTNGDDLINLVELEGVVTSIYCPNNKVSVIRLGLDQKGNGKLSNFPNIVGYGNAAEFIKNQIKENNVIRIKGVVQTPKNKNISNHETQESLVVNEIQIINNEE